MPRPAEPRRLATHRGRAQAPGRIRPRVLAHRFRTTLLALAIILGGCFPHDAGYQFGLSTSEIVGYVEPDTGALDMQQVLVVAFQYHYLLETMEGQERVYRVTADLRSVERDGTFRVPMASDVVTLELVVVAPDRLSTEFRFNRQIGIGQVSYRPVLLSHPRYYAHFYTYVSPMLSNLIVEQRYRLSPEDQQRLGDWLSAESARMDALRAADNAAPPGEEAPPPDYPQEGYELSPPLEPEPR